MDQTLIAPLPAISPVVARLLLTAPKDRRLDLALASMMIHEVRQVIVVNVVKDQRQETPIWYFGSQQKQGGKIVPLHAYSPDLEIFTLLGIERPDTVPYYTSFGELYTLRDWLCEHGRFSISYEATEICVAVESTEKQHQARAAMSPENKINLVNRMIGLAALHVYASDLVPYLESDEPFRPARPATFLEMPLSISTQQVVFVPVFVPQKTWEPLCMHQEYDREAGKWVRCSSLKKRRKVGDDNPEQCACCGGYYCNDHFSDFSMWFDAAPEERTPLQKGGIYARQEFHLCQNCALLSDDDIERLRATRLAANGKEAI